MSRAVVAGILLVAFALAGCGGKGNPYGAAPACPLLADLARTGQTVAQADVSDPDAFDATMRDATKAYLSTAKKLRDAVPANLEGDVDRMITAAEQQRFADATAARARVDAYARANCNAQAR
jgi:uncharacterized protein YbjT (DUF2867 family)